MTARYKILFAVEILHTYYSDDKCRDFTLTPSAATKQLLQKGKLLYKDFENQLWVLAKVQDDGADMDKPFIATGPDEKFVFYLQLTSSAFMNATNLDLDALQTKRFYFSNVYHNKGGDVFNLTQAIAPYSSAVHYTPGMAAFVDPGANATVPTVFESSKDNPSGGGSQAPAGVTDAFWRARGRLPFATANDLLPFVKNITSFLVNAALDSTYTVKAFALNKTNNRDYDVEVPLTRNTALSFSDTKVAGRKNVQVDLTALVPGRYKVQINADTFDVYVDDSAVDESAFGVVEIMNHLPGSDEFALLDAAGKVKDKLVGGKPVWLTYTIRFANRLAFFKYITVKRGVTNIVDNRPAAEKEYDFSSLPVPPPPPLPPPPAELFVSDKPVPLTQKLNIFDLVLTHPISSEAPKAPAPNPLDAGVLSRSGTDFYYTIYLNY